MAGLLSPSSRRVQASAWYLPCSVWWLGYCLPAVGRCRPQWTPSSHPVVDTHGWVWGPCSSVFQWCVPLGAPRGDPPLFDRLRRKIRWEEGEGGGGGRGGRRRGKEGGGEERGKGRGRAGEEKRERKRERGGKMLLHFQWLQFVNEEGGYLLPVWARGKSSNSWSKTSFRTQVGKRQPSSDNIFVSLLFSWPGNEWIAVDRQTVVHCVTLWTKLPWTHLSLTMHAVSTYSVCCLMYTPFWLLV